MTPTSTLVEPHGTEVVHAHGRCTMLACRDAHNARQRNRRRMMAYGQWQPTVDAKPVRAHVRTLLEDPKWSLRGICSASGVPMPTLASLLYTRGDQPPSVRVTQATAQALLNVEYGLDALPDACMVSAIGSARRLRALHAIGWPLKRLGPLCGLSVGAGQRILSYDLVTAETARAIRTLYNTYWDKRPTDFGVPAWLAERAIRYAASTGWAGPLQWDDQALDHPDAYPDWTGHCGSPDGWLLHITVPEAPCQACAAHAVALQEQEGSAAGALARQCTTALGVLDFDRRPRADVAELIGLSMDAFEHALRRARRISRDAGKRKGNNDDAVTAPRTDRTQELVRGLVAGQSLEEVASNLGITPGSVERTWYRERKRARDAGLPVPERPKWATAA